MSSVEETKRKLEKQLDASAKKGYKPSSNAVPMGFVANNGNQKNQV
jgi:hypothetical protein